MKGGGGINNIQKCQIVLKQDGRLKCKQKEYHKTAFLEIIDSEANRRFLVPTYLYDQVGLIDDKTHQLYIFDNSGDLITDAATASDILMVLLDTAEKTKYNMCRANNILHDYRFKLIDLCKPKGCFNFNVDRMTNRIANMNERIHEHCKSLSLKFDHLYNLPGEINSFAESDVLTLCLYYKGDCVSSIQVVYTFPGTVSIDSKTGNSHQKKGYNKFLRAAVIILCDVLNCNENKISSIRSLAINPISAWVLVENFDVTFKEYDDLVEELARLKDLHPELTEFQTFEMVFNKYDALIIDVEVNDDNIKKAKDLFMTMLKTNKVVCPKEGGGTRRRRRKKKRSY